MCLCGQARQQIFLITCRQDIPMCPQIEHRDIL